MSTLREPEDVKLVLSLFSPQEELLERAVGELQAFFGPPDWRSPLLYFDRTRFYEREMGWPLYRRFVSYLRLIRPEEIVQAKLVCNQIEAKHSSAGKRRINIDPGCVSLERLILTTGKNYTHRIYLSKGVYADLTLVFRKGSFVPLEWTYPDYADPVIIAFFNQVRVTYKKQLRSRPTDSGDPGPREAEGS